MKSKILKTLSIIMGMVMSISFVSCSDDDDDNSNDSSSTKKTTSVLASYSVDLSDDIFELWDIEVTYTGPGGLTITDTFTNNFVLQLTLNASDAAIPTTYSLKVVGKPKAETPTIEDDRSYTLSHGYSKVVDTYNSSGSRNDGISKNNASSMSAKGSSIASLVTSDYQIINTSCTITVD